MPVYLVDIEEIRLISRNMLGFCFKIEYKDFDMVLYSFKTSYVFEFVSIVKICCRMYQALLASGDQKSAANILSKIPRDDPHVCCVIKACQQTYKSAFVKSERKKKLKAPMKVLGDLFSEAGK